MFKAPKSAYGKISYAAEKEILPPRRKTICVFAVING